MSGWLWGVRMDVRVWGGGEAEGVGGVVGCRLVVEEYGGGGVGKGECMRRLLVCCSGVGGGEKG